MPVLLDAADGSLKRGGEEPVELVLADGATRGRRYMSSHIRP